MQDGEHAMWQSMQSLAGWQTVNSESAIVVRMTQVSFQPITATKVVYINIHDVYNNNKQLSDVTSDGNCLSLNVTGTVTESIPETLHEQL